MFLFFGWSNLLRFMLMCFIITIGLGSFFSIKSPVKFQTRETLFSFFFHLAIQFMRVHLMDGLIL